jgi:uncharacterized repeat protein (TIGR01451 family)
MITHRRVRLGLASLLALAGVSLLASAGIPALAPPVAAATLTGTPFAGNINSEQECGTGGNLQVTTPSNLAPVNGYPVWRDPNGPVNLLGTQGNVAGATFTAGQGGDLLFGGFDPSVPKPWVLFLKNANADEYFLDPAPGDVLNHSVAANNINQITACLPLANVAISKTWLPNATGAPASLAITVTCTRTIGAQGNNPGTVITHVDTVTLAAPSWSVTYPAVAGWSCTATEPAIPGFRATAASIGPVTVAASGTTFAFTNTKLRSLVALTKTASATQVAPGTNVTYTITATNTGNYDLTAAQVVVSDNQCALNGPTGDVGSIGILSINETWTYTCTVALNADTTNTATVTFPDGATTASVFVDVLQSGIQIVKTASPSVIRSGTDVTYTFAVSKTGAGDITGVTVTDNRCSPVTFQSGDAGIIGVLEAGETWLYRCTHAVTDAMMTAGTTTVTNVGTATGTNGNQQTTASDTADVRIIHPSMTLTKVASSLNVLSGSTVTYTYAAANTGDVEIRGVTLIDDKCAPATLTGGDTDADGNLDVSEVWTFQCVQALADTTTNIATLSGLDPLDRPVTTSATATVTAFTTTTTTTSTTTTTTTTTAAPGQTVATTATTAGPTSTTTTAVVAPTTPAGVAAPGLILNVPPIPTLAPQVPATPTTAAPAAPAATTPATVAAIEVIAASLPTAPPVAQVLGSEVAVEEPAFTGSPAAATARLAGIALLLGAIALFSVRRRYEQ